MIWIISIKSKITFLIELMKCESNSNVKVVYLLPIRKMPVICKVSGSIYWSYVNHHYRVELYFHPVPYNRGNIWQPWQTAYIFALHNLKLISVHCHAKLFEKDKKSIIA